jgi:uncharacterized protein YlaI
MSDELWQCEHCNAMCVGDPAATETAQTHEGPIELWFCEDCTDE